MLLTIAPLHMALAAPGASPWASNDQSRMRLVAAATAADGDGGLMLGLHVELNPGWKIYWRSAGESGLPPRFDWSGSTNVSDVETLWPAPKRYTIFGFDTFAYADEVVYPARARIADPSRPADITLDLQYGLCRDICVPYEAKLTLHVPAGQPAHTVYAPLIARYADKVPPRVASGQAAHGLAVTSVSVTGAPGEETLAVALRSDRPLAKTDVIVEASGDPVTPFFFARPAITPQDGGHAAIARIPVTHGKKASVAGKSLMLTVIAGDRAIEWAGMVRPED